MFLVKRTLNRFDKIQEDQGRKIEENEDSYQDLKYMMSEHYAKKSDLEKAMKDIQDSVEKVEQKVDDMPEKLAIIFNRKGGR